MVGEELTASLSFQYRLRMIAKTTFDPWLEYYHPRRTCRIRLFCFPYAGNGAVMFRSWQDAIPDSIELCPVQLPGRGRRLHDPPFTRLTGLIQAVSTALHPLLDKPFALFGHSMGALICFELARAWRRELQLTPEYLFVSGRRAPQLSVPDSPTFNLPEAELIVELRRLNGTPEDILSNPGAISLMMPLLRADFEVVQTYLYSSERPLDCPIKAIGGLEDMGTSQEHLLPWREQTANSFSLSMFPGDHFFINQVRRELCRLLASTLYPLTQRLR
jgi:medium-chain acyl-[acyl-carrier-protein] hydrolase